MGDEAFDPTLRPRADVGVDPAIVLTGRVQARTGDETPDPTPNPAQPADEPGSARTVRSGEDRLREAGFQRIRGAWRR